MARILEYGYQRAIPFKCTECHIEGESLTSVNVERGCLTAHYSGIGQCAVEEHPRDCIVKASAHTNCFQSEIERIGHAKTNNSIRINPRNVTQYHQ